MDVGELARLASALRWKVNAIPQIQAGTMVARFAFMEPRRIVRLFGLVLVAMSAWVSLAKPAHADEDRNDGNKRRGRTTTISGDLDYAHSAGSGIGSGWGFGVRVGQRLHVPLVALDPEIGFTLHDFNNGLEPTIYRGILGLRLGLLEIVRPGVYGHVGIGRINFGTESDLSHTAFTYDVGAFLDFTLIPLLDFGVHASYDGIASGDHVDSIHWWTAGFHAGLVF